MKKILHTRECHTAEDIRNFFDASAQDYQEAHGEAQQLLNYRLGLIRKFGQLGKQDVLLDVGCGTGLHLFGLAAFIAQGVGIDFSPQMIATARELQERKFTFTNITFQVDDAQQLQGIADQTMDVVLCVGTFEHLPQKEQTLQQMQRVLKSRGRLLLFTPNGNFLWYRFLAPLFRYDTRHLSTDQFVTPNWLKSNLMKTGYEQIKIGYWTFIPRGDLSLFWAFLLNALDLLGRILIPGSFRSGLLVRAVKSS